MDNTVIKHKFTNSCKMETNKSFDTQRNQLVCTADKKLEDNVQVRTDESVENFISVDNNQDDLQGVKTYSTVEYLKPSLRVDELSDLEQYLSAQEQLEDIGTSGSNHKGMLQKPNEVIMQKLDVKTDEVCRRSREKSRDSSVERHRKRHSPSVRNSVEQRHNSFTFPSVTQDCSSSYMNPTYEYSEENDDWVSSLGQAYKAHQNHLSHSSLSTVWSRPDGQQIARSKTLSHSSKSPTSVRSPSSSKSATPRLLETNNAMHSGSSRSQLPLGVGKSSTLCKSKLSNAAQGHSGGATLQSITAASNSKMRTPHKLPSHNTSMLSEGVVCRICHDGDESEVLISPCYCAGSMGLLHVSCLQRWLGSSNKTSCEICNFEFALQKKTMPISKFLKDPGTTRDKRHLICDIVCFLVLTPLTILVIWICIHSAVLYYTGNMARAGLIGLAVSLILLYIVWVMVAMRHNLQLWRDWKMFHQEVNLVCTPSINKKSQDLTVGSAESRSTLGSIHLQSIKISIQGPMTRYKRGNRNERMRRSKEKQGTSDRISDIPGRKSDRMDKSQNKVKAREAVKSVSQNIQGTSDQGREISGIVRNIQAHGQSGSYCGKRSQDVRNCHVSEENQHYNAITQKRADENSLPAKNIRKLNFFNNIQKEGRPTLYEVNQLGRRPGPDMRNSESFKKTGLHNIYYNVDGQSSVTSTSTWSPRHESTGFTKGNSVYGNIKQNNHKAVDAVPNPQQMHHLTSVRSHSSTEGNKSCDTLHDFIAQWVNDQTQVLVGQNQTNRDLGSAHPSRATEYNTEVLSVKNKASWCENSQEVNFPKEKVKNANNIENQTMVRKPATLSSSSSDVSFGQIMKENNLVSSSVASSDRQSTY